MTPRTLQRLARMSGPEMAWRAGAAARILWHRSAASVRPPRWTRPADADARHREISEQIAASTRFVIVPSRRTTVVERIARAFPRSTRQAVARADRLLFGDYDLLGYRGLRFDRSGRFEWNYDPVHDRHAPAGFWTTVPYLDPSTGDHKIIWELNRHQHWIALGRAYWLSGESKYRDRCLAELASWLDANPPLVGVNWTSMLELAMRSLSWLWALHFFADPDADDSSPWTVDLLVALERQLDHVEQNLSYYFSPNTHLTGEALALYVAGQTLPHIPGSTRRADIGRRVLVAEIDRQICRDGGHCERSAHYHRYTHDFYALALAVARLSGDPVAPTFARALGRLAFATRVLADDRGVLPHLGDDDGGVLVPLTGRRFDDARDSLSIAAALLDRPDLQVGELPEEVYWWLANPAFDHPRLRVRAPHDAPAADDAARRAKRTLPSVALEDTGYYVSRGSDGTQLIVDGGPHGYRNCGHAHADALALTLTLRGAPLLIDAGAGCYTVDVALRDRMRSTALHNTVTVDNRSQSTPAGPFHWTQTANAAVLRWRANDGFDYFDGTHDGYGEITHRRRVLAVHGDVIAVADLVTGPAARASLHWHLDPRWRVDLTDGAAMLSASGDRASLFVVGAPLECFHGDQTAGLGWYSPAYGRVEPTFTIRAMRDGQLPCWFVTLVDVNGSNPIVRVDAVPVWAAAGAMDHGTAVRVTRAASTDYILFVEPNGTASSWRVAEFETDARLLFCSIENERRLARVALVDGSFVRTTGRGGLQLALPSVASDLHLDLAGEPRVAGPASGARLVIAGREHRLTRERRAAPRHVRGESGVRTRDWRPANS